MTDDIIIRLRNIAALYDCDNLPDDTPEQILEAADEIENLRYHIKARDLQILANFKVIDTMHKELHGHD